MEADLFVYGAGPDNDGYKQWKKDDGKEKKEDAELFKSFDVGGKEGRRRSPERKIERRVEQK